MNIKLLGSYLLSLLIISGCAVTGEAEDKWDEEEKEAKISLGSILGKSKQQKENEALKERIERLERGTAVQQTPATRPVNDPSINQLPPTATVDGAGGITPPSMNRSRSTPSSNANTSVSYQDWLRAKNSNSDQYKDFKEYQEWLEFQRAQKNPQ